MTINNQKFPPQVKGHPLLEYCWRETHWKNSNVILFVTGLPGKGKTIFAEYLMWALDRDSNNCPRASLKNFVFTSNEFVDATRAERNRHPGRVIIWEEPYAAGIEEGGANSRQFMTKGNLQIATMFGTMRKNNHIILLTMPMASSFDKQARGVAHGIVHVTSNDGECSSSRVLLFQLNPFFDKVYKKRIRWRDGHEAFVLDSMVTPLPPKDFHLAFLEKSNWYKDKWAKEISKTIKVDKQKKALVMNGKQKKEWAAMRFTLDQDKYRKSIQQGNGIREVWNYGLFAKDFGISFNASRAWIAEFTS